MMFLPFAAALALMSATGAAVHIDPLTQSIPGNADWVKPQTPLKLYGNSYFVGDTAVTAIFTPGHTPGSVSWTWKTCEGQICVDVVFASSLNAVANGAFTYTAHPDVTAALRASIDRVEALPCDLLISAHPDNSGGDVKIAALQAGATPNPFLDPSACRDYAERARGRLQTRLDREAP